MQSCPIKEIEIYRIFSDDLLYYIDFDKYSFIRLKKELYAISLNLRANEKNPMVFLNISTCKLVLTSF